MDWRMEVRRDPFNYQDGASVRDDGEERRGVNRG